LSVAKRLVDDLRRENGKTQHKLKRIEKVLKSAIDSTETKDRYSAEDELMILKKNLKALISPYKIALYSPKQKSETVACGSLLNNQDPAFTVNSLTNTDDSEPIKDSESQLNISYEAIIVADSPDEVTIEKKKCLQLLDGDQELPNMLSLVPISSIADSKYLDRFSNTADGSLSLKSVLVEAPISSNHVQAFANEKTIETITSSRHMPTPSTIDNCRIDRELERVRFLFLV
jgi:hypothetical protein